MIRRRRPRREIAFSFDSFLDVVANVVGIILRLILVAWVGAQSYSPLDDQCCEPPPPPTPLPAPLVLPAPTSPLAPEVARARAELRETRGRLREQSERLGPVREQTRQGAAALKAVRARRQKLEQERALIERNIGERGQASRALGLALQALSARSKQLLADLDALRKAPLLKKTYRYRTPVSQPVTQEVMFECRAGRVTLIDVASLEDKMRQQARAGEKELRQHWEMSGVTPPIGAFRLRYVYDRERTLLEDKVAVPPESATFRYSLASYQIEPIVPQRGESGDKALAAGSQFRNVVDRLAPQQTAVTLWVYPDSFPLYRQLRDYLHDRDMVVAGRPLLEGALIGMSRRGTASRGQ
jgi:hypothetical protein